MQKSTIEILSWGHDWIAHRDDGHDCAEGGLHGVADHPTAALRKLLKLEED